MKNRKNDMCVGWVVELNFLREWKNPGFVTCEKPVVARDLRGFNRLDMAHDKRDTRIVQSSLWLAQGWRVNCDIQILIHKSNPDFPDPSDIANVSDYVVSCACKVI